MAPVMPSTANRALSRCLSSSSFWDLRSCRFALDLEMELPMARKMFALRILFEDVESNGSWRVDCAWVPVLLVLGLKEGVDCAIVG